MRVLHIDSGREMRGGQYQVLYLLQELGCECTLLCPAEGPLMQAAQKSHLKAEPLNVASLARELRRHDIAHAHDAHSHTWAATLRGGPLIVSRRVAFPVSRNALSRWKYARAHHYIAVSEFVKRALIQAEVPEEKITVVYDGIRGLAASGDGDPLRIVASAVEDPMKGSGIIRATGLDVHFSSDLQRDLPGAAVFLYITQSEGLGSAALLAMSAGVPVVASNVGGLPEIVRHGETGLLTENDPGAIRNAVERVLMERKGMSAAAREHAARFTSAITASATMRVYECFAR